MGTGFSIPGLTPINRGLPYLTRIDPGGNPASRLCKSHSLM
jgi:hypothetical protein